MRLRHALAERVTSVPLIVLVATFTVAELADLVSSSLVAHELNPLAASVATRPLLSLALKLGLIAFVVSTAVICDRQRPGLARLVLVVGTLVGLFGALSNTHLTPFLVA